MKDMLNHKDGAATDRGNMHDHKPGREGAPAVGSPTASALEDQNIGIVETDREGRIEHADRAAAALLHTDPLAGKTLGDVFPGAAYRELLEKARLSLEGNTPSGLDLPSPGGGGLLLHCRMIPSGKGLVLTLEDVSEKRRREEALRVSEARYRSIFDFANDAIFIHDPETGAILEVNGKMTEMYGYTAEEARAITVEDISSGVPPYDQEGAVRKIRSAVLHGGERFEWQAKDKSGRIFWTEVTLKTVETGGRLIVIAIVRDITDRKIADEALKESEERFRAVFDSAAEAIVVTDPEGAGKVLSANPAALRMFGYPEGEFVGLDRESILVTGEPSAQAFLERRGGKGADAAVLTYKRKDGTRFIGELSSVFFDDMSGKRKAVAVIRDITERRKAEEALRASEERYRKLYDSMSQGVIEFDAQSRLVSANRAAERILGLDLDRMRGSTIREMFKELPEISKGKGTVYRASELALIHAQITGKAMRGRKVRAWNPAAGEYRWVLVDSFPRFENGEEAHGTTFVIFSDITELMRVQEALEMAKLELEQRVRTRTSELKSSTRELAEQKELLQVIIDRIPVILTFWSPQGKLRLVNKEFERLTGWSQEEAVGMDILASVFPDPVYRERIHRLAAKADPGWDEFEIVTRSGNRLTVSWAAVRFSDGSLVGIGIDVTERKKMELDLVRLFAAMEQTNEAVALAGADGVIEYVNPAYEKMSGYRRRELIGKRVGSFREYFAGRDLEETLARSVEEGRAWRGRRSRKKKTGELIDVDVAVSPVRDGSGRIINYISVARDVTNEVRMQKQISQTQKLEAIGALAGGIAHDLKNILTPILLNTEIALEEVGSGHPARQAIEEALDAARLGRDLVKEILTFSRRTPRKKTLVNVPAVIRETIPFLRSSLPAGIDIRSEIKDTCVMACADPTQIKQVLINLGSNAGYAMRERGGTLDVIESSLDLDKETAEKISPRLAPGTYIQVTVRDTGSGMDEETLEHIFEPFFSTKKGEGTGMGLAVAHGIVEEHHGAITVQSRPGRGSSFSVYLPGVEGECPREGAGGQTG